MAGNKASILFVWSIRLDFAIFIMEMYIVCYSYAACSKWKKSCEAHDRGEDKQV